jgi:uncharacterized membrane protein YhhN
MNQGFGKRPFLVVSVLALALDLILTFFHYSCRAKGKVSPFHKQYPFFKFCIVPLMGVIWYQITPVHSKIIFFYVVFASLGDLLLLNWNFEVYAIGGVFFLLSHVLMVIQFDIHWRKVQWWVYLMMVPITLLITFFVIPALRLWNIKSISFGLYAIFLEIGSVSAIARVHKLGLYDISYWLGVVGYTNYVISDIILMVGELKEVIEYAQISVMVMYVSAQAMLMFSVALEARKYGQEKLK